MLLFIDEADAFLCRRESAGMSEAMRAALNAVLYRTGGQQRDFVLVLATNRPEDLDAAVADRVDELLEFDLPLPDQRAVILNMYMRQYITEAGAGGGRGGALRRLLFGGEQAKIIVEPGVDEAALKAAAAATDGFSGRELAKLMAAVQGEVYGRADRKLTRGLLEEVVAYKVGLAVDIFSSFVLC